jgi:hypothetical protein
VRVNCPLSYSGYRIVEKFTADFPIALQIRDLLRYDLFGERARGVSSITIDNNYLLTPKSLREAVFQSGNHNACLAVLSVSLSYSSDQLNGR